MPLTFAHPAAVLPFSNSSKYVNMLAMVLGSMAPDFEYFLNGRPHGAFGHTYTGFILLNLPILIIVYIVYRMCIHKMLMVHLPNIIQPDLTSKARGTALLNVIVFLYSALFGMFTHVAWDAFTHSNGFVVRNVPLLSHTIAIFERNIPIYKFLQHGSTIVGLTLIGVFLYMRALNNTKKGRIQSKQKWLYWGQIALFTIGLFSIWQVIDSVTIQAYGVIVVRLIDCALMSLLVVSLYVRQIYKVKRIPLW